MTLKKIGALPKIKGSWTHFVRLMESLGRTSRLLTTGVSPGCIWRAARGILDRCQPSPDKPRLPIRKEGFSVDF